MRTGTELRRLGLTAGVSGGCGLCERALQPAYRPAECVTAGLCREEMCPVLYRVRWAGFYCPDAQCCKQSLWPTQPRTEAGPLTVRLHSFSKPVRPSEADPCLAGLLKILVWPLRRGISRIRAAVLYPPSPVAERLPLVCTKVGQRAPALAAFGLGSV